FGRLYLAGGGKPSCRAVHAWLQQTRVLGRDRGAELAGSLDQAIAINNLDMTAAVVDEIRLLQRVGHKRYAVAARADHLRHRFPGQDKRSDAAHALRMQQATR